MALADWVVSVVARFGYVGVGALVALENLLPPIPSEVVLPLSGFAAQRGILTFWGAVVAATVGAVVGALALYALGRRVGETRVRHLVARHGHWVLLGPEDVDRADAWFARHGERAVLVGRLIPGVRSFVSLPAGAARMPVARFALLTAIGSGAWNLLLVGVGYQLGARWHLVADWIGRAGTFVWISLAALVAWFIARRLRARRRGDAGA